jgi:hypothetical protein
MVTDVEHRLQILLQRVRTVYDGLGHSSGRPYVYFVYPPGQERAMRRLLDEYLASDDLVRYYPIDILPITIKSLAGQEERRRELLESTPTAGGSIVRLWGRQISRHIQAQLEEDSQGGAEGTENVGRTVGRPVIVLYGLASLHPLGNPTGLMESMAEQEIRDPSTGTIVPVVLLVPGIRPPQTSRSYYFLGHERLRLDFYRGEEA